MNKRKRKKAEKRTVQYISKLRKTDKQAWRETMIRRRRHAMVYFGRTDNDALNQILRYNLLVYELTEAQLVDYIAENGEPPQLCEHRRRWLVKLCGDRAPLVIDNLPTFPEFMEEARARLLSPGQESRPLVDALTQGFAAGIETGKRKVARAFEDLAKRASETIRDLFQ